MTTERDLIQRLTERLDHLHSNYDLPSQSALIAEALDYLDQPEPGGLTDEPLGDLIDKWVQEAFLKKPYGCKHPTHTYVACKAFEHGRNHAARTALAQPEPKYPSDQELLELMPKTMRDEFSYAAKICSDATGNQVKPRFFRVVLNTAALEYAQAVFARYAS